MALGCNRIFAKFPEYKIPFSSKFFPLFVYILVIQENNPNNMSHILEALNMGNDNVTQVNVRLTRKTLPSREDQQNNWLQRDKLE